MLKQILIVSCMIVGGFAFPTSAGAFDQNGFQLEVRRSESLTDLQFTWHVRPPFHYDVFNVRIGVSDGSPERQVEVRGGAEGTFPVRNALGGYTYTFKVQGCDKKTFGSKCTPWSQTRFNNVLGNLRPRPTPTRRSYGNDNQGEAVRP
jgi:hypothetical protein